MCSASGAAGIGPEITAAAAAPAGTTGIEGGTAPVLTASIAAVFPTSGARTPVGPVATTGGRSAGAASISAAAVPTPIAATAAAAWRPTTATAATTARFSLVDAKRATHQLGCLQAVDGPAFHLGIGHLHEGESALAARIPLQG